MAAIDQRLSGLTPERRRLLDKLLASRNSADGKESVESGAEKEPLLSFQADDPSAPDSVKAMFRKFYNTVSAQLDSSLFGEFSYFLNYGYTPDLSPHESIVELPPHYLNRNSVRLVLELVGRHSIDGSRMLDVGCGRGGTVHVLTTFFKPASVTGLDLSSAAIAFCRKTHKDPRTKFQEGDAENLPFEPESFDVVTNVESSHSYPNIFAFYDGVYRSLARHGRFLYTDVHAVDKWSEYLSYLQSLGFVLEDNRDITANVLLSCEEIARTRVQAFSAGNDSELMANFLAVPGSEVYDSMQRRIWTYNIARFRKV